MKNRVGWFGMSVDADADADADAASGADEPEAPASTASAAQVARTLSEPHTGTLLLALALSHAQRGVIVALTHMFVTPEVRTGNSPSAGSSSAMCVLSRSQLRRTSGSHMCTGDPHLATSSPHSRTRSDSTCRTIDANMMT